MAEMSKSRGVRVREIVTEKERYAYRTPLKFGGVANTHTTLLNVRIRVESADGRSAWHLQRDGPGPR